jgi:hypothetical protein
MDQFAVATNVKSAVVVTSATLFYYDRKNICKVFTNLRNLEYLVLWSHHSLDLKYNLLNGKMNLLFSGLSPSIHEPLTGYEKQPMK